MYDNSLMPGENAGETVHESFGELSPEQAARASEWEAAMQEDSVSEFAGEWGYGEQQAFVPDSNSVPSPELFEQHVTPDQNLAGASRITSYGFDTASRIYGLSNVLTQIYNTDITANEAVHNPLGAIYQNLEPNPQNRAYLFREIQKDTVVGNEQNDDPNLNTARIPVGLTPYGDFYDKELAQNDRNEQTSIDAIVSLKKLLDSLATESRFEPLRQRAAEQHRSIIDLLVGGETNPTITIFLNGVGGELSNASVDDVISQIEERAEAALSEEEAAEPHAAKDLENGSNGNDDLELAQTDEAAIDTESLSGVEDSATDANQLFEARLVDRFNQSLGFNPQANVNSELIIDDLSDDDFAVILKEESAKSISSNDFDSDAIISHLKSQIPDDFEEAKKRQQAAKSGDFSVAHSS